MIKRIYLFYFVLLGITVFSLSNCIIFQRSTIANYHERETPVGQTKISENLFCDKTEITNFHYLEFLSWTNQVFGRESVEYLQALPIVSCWSEVDECLAELAKNYLRHPSYRDFPLVGISQEQARLYSRWRSDRVFEYQLIKLKLLDFNVTPTPENHFTIERYFTSTPPYKRDPRIKYYAEYSLPNKAEREQIMAYNDSITEVFLENCKSKTCKACQENFPDTQSAIQPCKGGVIFSFPTRPVTSGCQTNGKNSILELRGNVAEWLHEDSLAAGYSWKDNYTVFPDYYVDQTPINAWTGFRCVGRWKKWID